MRILFVGVFEPESSSHHPMVRALRALGHEVECFDYRKEEREARSSEVWEYRFQKHLQKLRRPWAPEVLRGAFFRIPGIRRMNERLKQRVAASGCGLVLLAKAEKVDYRNIPFFNEHARTWYYFMDPYRIAREMEAGEYAARTSFASATRSNLVEDFARKGARAVFLTQGVDTTFFHPAPSPFPEFDVVFVGQMRRHRRRLLSRVERAGIRVTTFGPGADNPPVYGKDLAAVYRRARIVLNLNSDPRSTGFSLRVFQVMGTGAMLLSEYCPDLERVFENGKDLAWFRTADECVELLSYYLAHPGEREQIAEAGCRTVHEHYTWERVMERLIREVESS